MRHRTNIYVITNAINIGMELCNQPAIRTTVTGGVLAWVWAFALVGPHALQTLEDINLDRVFLSVTGFDLERGVATLEIKEATVTRKMAAQARQVIVVADSSKIGLVGRRMICPIDHVDVLVTDSGLSAMKRKQVERAGVKVFVANE